MGFSVAGDCVAHGTTCPHANSAALMCGGAADCPTGQKCCGSADSNTKIAQTTCQTLTTSGTCPGSNTTTSGFAQVCKTTSECGGGMRCILQTCNVGGNTPAPLQPQLSMCGLQAQAPFDCAAN
jgi:hypothetical protein